MEGDDDKSRVKAEAEVLVMEGRKGGCLQEENNRSNDGRAAKKAAKEPLTKAVKAQFNAYVKQARIFEGEARYKKAVKCYERARELFPNDKIPKKIKTLKGYIAKQKDMGFGFKYDPRTDSCVVHHKFFLNAALFNKLFKHQKDGVRWLWSLYRRDIGGILADDMGLGKTIQIAAFLSGMWASELIDTVLLVLPLSLVPTWMAELKIWAPELPVHVYHGEITQRAEALRRCKMEGGICLTTYGLVVTSAAALGTSERRGKPFHKWDYVILDEGHKIKNPSTEISKSIRVIRAARRLLLTGTPVQNKLGELWALFDFVTFGTLLGSWSSFHRNFENPIVNGSSRDAKEADQQRAYFRSKELRDIIRPHMLRREKKANVSIDSMFDPATSGAVGNEQNMLSAVFSVQTIEHNPDEYGDDSDGNTDDDSDGECADKPQNEKGMDAPTMSSNPASSPSTLRSSTSGHGELDAADKENSGEHDGALPIVSVSKLHSTGNSHSPLKASAGKKAGNTKKRRNAKKSGAGKKKLPKKSEFILWVRLSSLQEDFYRQFLTSGHVKAMLLGKANVLTELIVMKKLCDHPRLLRGQAKLHDALGLLKPTNNAMSSSSSSNSTSNSNSSSSLPSMATYPKPGPLLATPEKHADATASASYDLCSPEGRDALAMAGLPSTPAPIFSPEIIQKIFSDDIGVEDSIEMSGKMQVFCVLMRRLHEEGHRVLVFTRSKKILDMMGNFLFREDFRFLRMDGDVSSPILRQEMVDSFNKDESIFCMLLTTQVGGVGLTLTGADRVVIYDPSWNPTDDSQAVDRAYRIGQQKKVVVYRLITCGTIEEKIFKRQIFKMGLSMSAMKRGGNPYNYFTMDEIGDLFKLDDTVHSWTKVHLRFIHANQDQDVDAETLDHLKCIAQKSSFLDGHSNFGLLHTIKSKAVEESKNGPSEEILRESENIHKMLCLERDVRQRVDAGEDPEAVLHSMERDQALGYLNFVANRPQLMRGIDEKWLMRRGGAKLSFSPPKATMRMSAKEEATVAFGEGQPDAAQSPNGSGLDQSEASFLHPISPVATMATVPDDHRPSATLPGSSASTSMGSSAKIPTSTNTPPTKRAHVSPHVSPLPATTFVSADGSKATEPPNGSPTPARKRKGEADAVPVPSLADNVSPRRSLSFTADGFNSNDSSVCAWGKDQSVMVCDSVNSGIAQAPSTLLPPHEQATAHQSTSARDDNDDDDNDDGANSSFYSCDDSMVDLPTTLLSPTPPVTNIVPIANAPATQAPSLSNAPRGPTISPQRNPLEPQVCQKHKLAKLRVNRCRCYLSAEELSAYFDLVRLARDEMTSGQNDKAYGHCMQALNLCSDDIKVHRMCMLLGQRVFSMA